MGRRGYGEREACGQVVAVFEVNGVDHALQVERIDDERRRKCLLAISYPFTVSSRGTMAWSGQLQTHLDPAAAPRVEQVEGDALRAGDGEELDRNGGQAQGDVEVL